MKPFSIGILAIAAVFAALPVQVAAAMKGVEYNRDIRPILADNCFSCHGADSASRKASLRLDHFEDAIASHKGSNPAIIPGKVDESEMIKRLLTKDEDDRMPPVKTKKAVTPQQLELLRNWIAQGAKYEAHWSLLAPQKPPLPKGSRDNWVRNPIDAFIMARLEKEGLKPAPEADRRTLARRLSLDLTGLPPTVEQVERFLSDKSASAYERLVDGLLASKSYGEHRARYWLDAARYADTHGIHIDNYREIWAYRDWVINAFNRNTPFDQFTVEQLAGDLLPNPTLDQKIATGFNRCNITTSEGGAIDEEYIVLYARDRTEATSAVWLGLTTGCAVCHDHKFDPISQKDFYSLSAFFNNTTQPAMDGNKKDTPPVVVVPAPKDIVRWEELKPLADDARGRVEKRKESAKPDYAVWQSAVTQEQLLGFLPQAQPSLLVSLTESNRNNFAMMITGKSSELKLPHDADAVAGAISDSALVLAKDNVPEILDAGNFDRTNAFSFGAWVRLDEKDRNGSLMARMDNEKGFRGWDLWMEDGRPGTHMVNKWPENALKVVSKKRLDAGKWAHVMITYDGSSKAEGVKIYVDGQPTETDRQSDKLSDTIVTDTAFKIGQRKTGDELEKAGVQDVRIYSQALSPEDAASLGRSQRMAWLVRKAEDKRSDEEKSFLYDAYLRLFDKVYMSEKAVLATLEKDEREIKMRGTIAHVMDEKRDAPMAHVLFRGEYDKRRDKVEAAVPKALHAMPSDLPRNRLGFAKWLLLPENPLTARVTVNRFWQEIFGAGLVRSAGDFGVMGELPSHPELLDWMAVDFRENGWDVKRFYKMMVMSATYRQQSVSTAQKTEKDPQNKLLARGPRFRLDAEMIRDYALAASGTLSPKIGGPSVKPYQPSGVWEMVAMPESDTSKYKQDSGDNLYRRSMYTFWKRTAPPASMDILNAPNRETCTVKRERTNTPLQALATLNDPQFIEAARRLAENTIKEGGKSPVDRVDYMAKRILARPLRSAERRVTLEVLKDLLAHYAGDADDAKTLVSVGESKPAADLAASELAAYTMLANQLLNLDEALTK